MTDSVPDYRELPLGHFLDMVASREPAPGGGASVALTGMAARVIDGCGLAAELKEKLAAEVAGLLRDAGVVPGLATVLISSPQRRQYTRGGCYGRYG